MENLQGKKLSFNTLYALARKWKLTCKITYEFSGMTDSKEKSDREPFKISLDELKKMKCHRNALYYNNDGSIEFWNCIYNATFFID